MNPVGENSLLHEMTNESESIGGRCLILEPGQLSSLKSVVPFDGSETRNPLYKSDFKEFATPIGSQAALYTTDDMLVGGQSFNVGLRLDKGYSAVKIGTGII